MRGPCRQARGYGIQKFKPELYLALEMWLRNTFLKQIEKDYFTMWGTIRGAGDSLLHLLKDSPGNADLYISQVMFRDAISRIVMEISSILWKTAHSICKATESESWRKSLKLCNKNLKS
ncbi:uncharacterized protein [Argopecten irradians]|uniref:uncharacterized protein n=1 Tax=Argopecten irradians TaxID=31199 RepID=UPI0037158E74